MILNEGKGFDLAESANGNLFVEFRSSTAKDNDQENDGNADLEADQEDSGMGEVKIRNSEIVIKELDGASEI